MADRTQQPPKTQRRRDQLSSMQMMFAAILAIGLLLAINFSSRIAAGQPLQQLHAQVEDEIEQLEREQAALIAERDFVRSDAYVEQWARDEGKMVRAGEHLVIPVPSANTPRQDEAAVRQLVVPVETTPPGPEPWQVWWALFFDSPVPDF
jgi:cell division protein FtsB